MAPLQQALTRPAAVGTGVVPWPLQGDSEFLVVRIGADEYGIDMRALREIRSWAPPLPLPAGVADGHAPCVCGMAHLRGVAVPVVDLRLGLGGPTARCDRSTVVVLAEVDGQRVEFLVDGLTHMAHIAHADIRPPAATGAPCQLQVRGEAQAEGRSIRLLDVADLLRQCGLKPADLTLH